MSHCAWRSDGRLRELRDAVINAIRSG